MGVFFTSVFGSIFGWIAAYFTNKLAFAFAALAMLMSITMTFYATLILLLNGLGGVITNESLLVGFWSVIPDNAVTCITACFAADLICYFYHYQKDTLQMLIDMK